jgi:hypothetical protein
MKMTTKEKFIQLVVVPAYQMDGVNYHSAVYALTNTGEIYLEDQKGWRRMSSLESVKEEINRSK